MYILGLSEGSIVTIGLTVIGFLITAIGVFLRYKQKADNADQMKQVDEKIKHSELRIAQEIEDDLKPINAKIDKHENQFEKFKKESFDPLKEDVSQIKIEQRVMQESFENLKELITSNHNEIKELFQIKDGHDRAQFKDLWKTVNGKEDRKSK